MNEGPAADLLPGDFGEPELRRVLQPTAHRHSPAPAARRDVFSIGAIGREGGNDHHKKPCDWFPWKGIPAFMPSFPSYRTSKFLFFFLWNLEGERSKYWLTLDSQTHPREVFPSLKPHI